MVNNYNLNYSQQIPYTAVRDVVPKEVNDKLPQNVQNFDTREALDNSGAVKAVKNKDTDPVTMGLTGVIWLGLANLSQFLNNNLAQDYDKTWFGKVSKFCEKISSKTTEGKIQQAKNSVSKFADKFEITSCLKHPTHVENSMAKSQGRGIFGQVTSDISSMLKTYRKFGGDGSEQKIIDLLQGTGKTASNADEALEILDKILDNSSAKDYGDLKTVAKNMQKIGDTKISVDKLATINIPFTNKKLFDVPNISFLKRKGSFHELANKLNVVANDNLLEAAGKSNLSKTMPKRLFAAYEGLTNGGAGGKIMIGLQAMAIAQALKAAMDAPEGEKVSTFMENMANDFSFFLAMPLQVGTSHTLGGLKYIGLGKEKGVASTLSKSDAIKQYKGMIENLNKQVDAGTISKIDYQKEVKNIKKFFKGDTKWYQKPFKAFGSFISTGLKAETIKPYIDKNATGFGAKLGNKIRSTFHTIKGPGFGSVLRFGVGMFVVGSLVSKVLVKASHLVFGRPTKSILDEEQEETKQANTNTQQINEQELAQKLQARPDLVQKIQTDPNYAQQIAQNPEILMQELNTPASAPASSQELYGINSKYLTTPSQNTTQPNPIQTNTNAIAQGDSQSQMDLFGLGKKKQQPTQEAKEEINSQDEPKRTYIPSSDPVVLQKTAKEIQLNADIQSALDRAQLAEENALKVL